MQDTYFQDNSFDLHYTPQKGEYDTCVFNGCDLSGQDLSEYKFTDCIFNHCNLSLATLSKTVFREVQFNNCKMLGLRFDTCNAFGLSFSFDRCQLNHSSFYKTKLKKTLFKNCQLLETDFAETDLSAAVFDNCDLAQASFDRSILEKTDFRTAYNYSIDPEVNKVKKARFSMAGIAGLLDKYDIEIEG